jgi:hypothetical protein
VSIYEETQEVVMKKCFFIAVVVCCLFSVQSFAQTSNATLGGTVSDASGALIPGVGITAINAATGIVTTSVSNEAGAYNFPNLQTGTYRVSAELPGFRTQTYEKVALGLSQQVRLNFTLQVAGVSTAVEVTVATDTLIATSSSSVGNVLPEYKVRDLPLGSRNVLDLISTTAGTGPSEGNIDGNFAGGRISAVNITRDGFVVGNGRYNQGTFSATYVSPDLVEEVRVVTATVDAEAGRGSGQVQMATRAGTNQFRGSAFWTNQNSALDAANWFNNFNNTEADWENRNQFGGRLGGPIIRNKTFFFFLVEEQRDVTKQSVIGTVLTDEARRGLFRYFPGANNANAAAANPTVDFSGNPVRPAAATGGIQQINLFTFDPQRRGYDPTGFVQNVLLSNMPHPNNFTMGDGLNTAGIQWTRRVSGSDLADGNSYDQNNRDQFNLRLDHNFNSAHKLSFVYTWERGLNHTAQAGLPNWPNGYQGANNKFPRLYTGSLVSTLSPTLLNELRVGLRRTAISSWAPFYVGRPGSSEGVTEDEEALKAFALLPVRNGIPLQPVTNLFATNIINWGAGDGTTRGSISPLWSYADNLSWSKGKHAFKMGVEFRRDRSLGWNDSNFTPQALFGAGATPTNITVSGLTQTNATVATNLLYDLSGSVGTIRQGAVVRDPKNPVFLGYQDGVKLKKFDYHANEFSGFFKDDWKVSPALTLNVGIHWEWFGVPYEADGLTGAPVGGASNLCGYSCGGAANLTRVQFVGKNSSNPDIKLRNDDWNNWAPSVGFSWSLPWLGKNKTVLRAGYGISYTGGELKGVPGGLNAVAGSIPGLFTGTGTLGMTIIPSTYTNLANISLPLDIPFAPLTPPPLNGTRGESIQAFADYRVAPYIQNFNFEIQRELASNLSLSVAYVGTKGTKLYGGLPLNVTDIYAKGPTGETLLEAFNTTRAGGNSVMFDQLLNGLTLPSGGGVVNTTTVRGSAALRNSTATRVFVANGNIGALADYLNRNTTVVAGQGGGIIRNSGLFPENWLVTNPQFNQATVATNPSSSTYHSLQVQVTRRLSQGFTNQTSYTWSRTIGSLENEAGTLAPRDPRNLSLDRAVLGFHRTHSLTSNGTFELPFGPNRRLFANAPGWMQRLTERWQLGAILGWSSGSPMTITAPVSTLWQTTGGNTPMLVGSFSKSVGGVTKVSNGVVYFDGYQQIADPGLAAVTTVNALDTRYTLFAIADAQGNPVLINPGAGQIGTLGRNVIEGPGRLTLDANLIKRVRIDETREFEFRLDSTNIMNHANFGEPTTNINSTDFGRITSASAARRFTVSARLNF